MSVLRLVVDRELLPASGTLWRCLAAAHLREFRLPTHVVVVGDLTDEDRELARRMWPLAQKASRSGWGRLTPQDVTMSLGDAPAPLHRGPRVVVHAKGGEDA